MEGGETTTTVEPYHGINKQQAKEKDVKGEGVGGQLGKGDSLRKGIKLRGERELYHIC